MSISYQSKDDRVQAQELKWRTLILKTADASMISGVGTATVVIDVKEPVESIAQLAPVVLVYSSLGVQKTVGSITVSGNTITLGTVGSPAATDVFMVNYVVAE